MASFDQKPAVPRTPRLLPLDVRRRVTPEDLDVSPALVGLPLARHSRRLAAITVDVAVVGLLSTLDNVWVLSGAALALALVSRYCESNTWLRAWPRLAWGLAIALLLFGAQQAWVDRGNPDSHDDREDRADLSDEDAQVAVAKLRQFSPAAAEHVASAVALSATARAASSASAASADASAPSADQRIATLQQELAEARRPKPFKLRTEISRWTDELGIGFGWAIVYFAMVPVCLPGQTLGKKLFGLRVVELTGKPMTLMRCLKRYGGYAAGLATGGLGFVQVLWDSNRQAIQDKTAHTVVIDLRGVPEAELQRLR